MEFEAQNSYRRGSSKLEARILTGGLSTRMGRDKSQVRIEGRSMSAHIRQTVEGMGLKVQTVRRDAAERCGPIGGIFTGLKTSEAEVILFLACDMPFVSTALLKRLLRALRRKDRAVFAGNGARAGFPLVLRREVCLPIVARQIECGEFSLQRLARALKARTVTARPGSRDLMNINTPAELGIARRMNRQRVVLNGAPLG